MAKVAVIGAGFVGLSSAYWLMQDGHSVSVFDPTGVGAFEGGASYGNAGTFATYACIPINNPSVFRDLPGYLLSGTSPLRVRWRYLPHLAPWLLRFLHSSTPARYTTSATALAALLARAYSGYEDLIAKSGLETFIQRQACLYLYSSANAFEAAAPSLKLRNRLGVATETLDRAAIHQLEPHLNPLFEKGVLFPDSWFLSNPAQFLTQLKDHLVNAGMVLHTQAVQSIAPRADGVSLQTEAGSAGFDYVAVCAGAHAGTFAQQCGDAPPCGPSVVTTSPTPAPQA